MQNPFYHVTLLFFLLLNVLAPVLPAQTDEPSASSTILVMDNNQLYEWDTETLSRKHLTEVSTLLPEPVHDMFSPAPIIIRPKVTPDLEVFYGIEAEGRDKRNLPIETRLIEISLTSAEKKVLLDRPGIYEIVLSPDSRHIFVAYYVGEFGVSRKEACILSLTNGICQPAGLDMQLDEGRWINNDSYLVIIRQQFHLVSLDGSHRAYPENEEWFIGTALVVPGTQRVLVSASKKNRDENEPPQFLDFDPQTGSLQSLYSSGDDIFGTTGDWEVSPDSRYMSYIDNTKAVVVEMETGLRIAEVEVGRVTQTAWLPDSLNYVLKIKGFNDAPVNIVRIDLTTGQLVHIQEGSPGFFIVP